MSDQITDSLWPLSPLWQSSLLLSVTSVKSVVFFAFGVPTSKLFAAREDSDG
jgi:hypothetical protein